MRNASERPTIRFAWRSLVPPLVVCIILIAVMALLGDGSLGTIFKYKLF